MSSVWKRLQRVGKKASKFQFTASYQSLTVECVRGGKWQPNKLIVVWTRRKRRKLSKPMSWQPGISNPFRGIIVWPEPEPVDITVTLYKDPKPDSGFEDKEWTFVIEDEAQNGRRKPIATGAINMVDYASVESHTFDVTLTLKVASKKLVSASLEFNLTCVLIKEGMATDDDMISIGSMMSLNDSYYLDDNDDDMEMVPSPRFHRRNISQGGNMKVQAVSSLQESDIARSRSPTASPVLSKKQGRIRSKSALGENTKTLVNDLLKEEGMKRLSTDSDASADISDGGQDTNDKSRMESELIKWVRTCTKGYRGVKVKNMTSSWRDGLAFCAILHSFHPDKVDFSSLDAANIKENNKLAFTAFEKLGIPRLLDPTQMMFTPIPDKLSVMTYVFQIKTHFSRTRQPLPPSPLSLETSPRPRRLPVPPQMTVTSTEEPTKQDDASVADNDSNDKDNNSGGDSKEAASKDSKEGCNPFLDDQEKGDETASPELSTDPSASRLSESNLNKTENEQDTGTTSSNTSVDRKNSVEENGDKKKDILLKSDSKPPPKPPRIYQTDNKEDAGLKTDDNVNKKEKTESKPFNPFDEDDNEEENETTISPAKSTKPSKGYNPFDDDVAADSSAEKDNKTGYNPFDDDDDEGDAAETDKNVEKKTLGMIKRQLSYPHHYNPFDEGDDEKSNATDESSERTKPKAKKATKDTALESTTKGYNPFEDDDDESVNDNNSAVQADSMRKSSTEKKTNVNRVAQSGTGSPSAALKPAETSAKKRRAPPPPAVRSSDDPWTARLPTEVTPTRHRRSRPTTSETIGEQQTSPNASPAKRTPKRAAPAPPRRPPLIPSFDEWKSEQTDGGPARDNERPAVSSVISSDAGDKNEKSESSSGASPKAAPKNSTNDAANQADIKLLARQVLMDARKKAGASGALPRERVAEIAKASKGPTADKTIADSDEREGGPQEKEMVDNQEALRKKENLRQRKEELLKRKKATEKAQKMVQNAVDNERAQKQASSPQQTTTEKTNQESNTDGTSTDGTSGDQKTVGNKNLKHRPLKLKDKENDENRRKLSPPPKNEFKESDELQRIREILNQGKKDRKLSNSDNAGQDKNSVRAQSPKPSQEGSRKMSHGKSSKRTAINGVKNTSDPAPPPRSKTRGPNAGLQAYVKSRKMNFEAFEVPSDRAQQGDKQGNVGTLQGVQDDDTRDALSKDEDGIINDEGRESGDPTLDLQDTYDYVREELKMLEEQQQALDKVGEKLEIELRRAMETKGKIKRSPYYLLSKQREEGFFLISQVKTRSVKITTLIMEQGPRRKFLSRKAKANA